MITEYITKRLKVNAIEIKDPKQVKEFIEMYNDETENAGNTSYVGCTMTIETYGISCFLKGIVLCDDSGKKIEGTWGDYLVMGYKDRGMPYLTIAPKADFEKAYEEAVE